MKKKFLRRAIFVLGTIAAFVPPAFAAEGISVRGHVFRSGGQETVAGATVTLEEGGVTASTNASGEFAFADIAPGSYTVIVAVGSARDERRDVVKVGMGE